MKSALKKDNEVKKHSRSFRFFMIYVGVSVVSLVLPFLEDPTKAVWIKIIVVLLLLTLCYSVSKFVQKIQYRFHPNIIVVSLLFVCYFIFYFYLSDKLGY